MTRFIGALCISLGLLAPAAAQAEERATPEQAKALVHNAIVHYRKAGPQKALADFADKKGEWVHGDLYVNVYDLKGNCLAHINEKTIGKNMIELRDVDGKYLIRERVERAAKEGSGWQEYKFYNPLTKKVEPKSMYFEKYENVVFAAGAYKPAN